LKTQGSLGGGFGPKKPINKATRNGKDECTKVLVKTVKGGETEKERKLGTEGWGGEKFIGGGRVKKRQLVSAGCKKRPGRSASNEQL